MNDYSTDVEHQAEVRSIRMCFFVNWREVLLSIEKKKGKQNGFTKGRIRGDCHF